MNIKYILIVSLLLRGLAFSGEGAWLPEEDRILITEVVASNLSVGTDEDGDNEDWIELHNPTGLTVDLSGWGLSDNAGNPFKWTFPEGVVMEPEAYLLVWASGKNRRDATSPLHTNYSVSVSGEDILLTTPDGARSDFIPALPMPGNVSVGRLPGEVEGVYYFSSPTPGAPNAGPSYSGWMAAPVLNQISGRYVNALTVDVGAVPEGSILRYTIDGSEPTSDSPLWEGPLELIPRLEAPSGISLIPTNPSMELDAEGEHRMPLIRLNQFGWKEPLGPDLKMHVVRVRAFGEDMMPSAIATGSYLVLPEGHEGIDLPLVSITINPEHLFDFEDGIYVPGKIFDEKGWPGANNWGRPNANYFERGDEWERPMHWTFIETDNTVLWDGGGGVRIHGGGSRVVPHKSLRLYARGGYGSSEFDGAFFGEGYRSSFRRLILRNSGQDAYQSGFGVLFRDGFMQGLVAHLEGMATQAFRPTVVFINGEYWGIHNLRERYDRHYLAGTFGADPDAVDYLSMFYERNGDHYLIEEGSDAHYAALIDYLENNTIADAGHYHEVNRRMDVENFMDYHAAQIYFRNTDWPGNNNEFWRARREEFDEHNPGPLDGRWRWMLFDTDFGYGQSGGATAVSHDTLTFATVADAPGWPNPYWSTFIFRTLLQNEAFRNAFINRSADLLNSVFRPEYAESEINRHAATIAREIPRHIARWRLIPDLTTWESNIQRMRTFAQQRPGYVRQHYLDYFGLSGMESLTVSVSDSTRGRIQVNRLLISPDEPGIEVSGPGLTWTGDYFAGVPVILTAMPAEGYRLSGWRESGQSGYVSTENPLVQPMEGAVSIEAVFEEIPAVEQPVILHAWDFEDGADFISPSFTLGGAVLSVEPGVGTEVVRNTAAQDFETAHLRVNNPLGSTMTFNLPTNGYEHITLDMLTRRSGQGAGVMTLAYTTDGESWTEVDTVTVRDAAPQAHHFDFSADAGVADNATFAVRLSFVQGDGGTAGNNRFDDIELRGLALPGTKLPPVANTGLVPEWVGLSVGEGSLVADWNTWFTDPEGTPLVFSVVSAQPEVLVAVLEDGAMMLHAHQAGEAMVTVTAADGVNPPVETGFRVLIYPRPHRLAWGHYGFGQWPADESAGSYPRNMLFLQSDKNDPGLHDPLTYAYMIPSGDAAEPVDVDFPYAASSRTRINGLGERGIAFINTGRGRDVGAALLALDTRGVKAIDLSWIAGTELPNNRIYAMRLQYRTNPEDAWSDLMVDGEPLEYVRHVDGEHEVLFGPVRLPPSLEEQANLQLQWRYYHVSGSSGARARLRLDDIVVAVNDPGENRYLTWLHEHGGDEELIAPEWSGPLANPLQDGIPNLLKYALGMSPGERVNSEYLSQGLDSEGGLYIRFGHNSSLEDIRYQVVHSPNLLDWSEVVFDSTHFAGPNSHGPRHEIRVPRQNDSDFIRLEIHFRDQ